MRYRCPGCDFEQRRDAGLRSGIQLVICADCEADGVTPEDFE